jgi:hypothetical protein
MVVPSDGGRNTLVQSLGGKLESLYSLGDTDVSPSPISRTTSRLRRDRARGQRR